MNKFAAVLKNLWKDQSGQGATEYVLLVVVVVALVGLFRQQIMDALRQKLTDLSASITGFTGEN